MITFRKAQLSDVDSLNTLVNSAYRGTSAKTGWTTEADLIDGQRTDPDALTEMIEDSKAYIELAFENEELIGCIYLKKFEPELYIGMLTVKPGLQGKGLGKTLMSRAQDHGRAWNLKTTRMTVISERPELINYYERMGFKWSGKTEPFPDHDPRNGKPRKKLTFLEYVKEL
jgi:ribosomal protein S18 acetylase RimI-like enzyme